MLVLAKENCNLHEPESVKQVIAAQKWKDSVKMLACYAYRQFAKMENISWEMPHYRQKETMLTCPDERDLDALINAARSKKMAAFLQTLKETYADPSEILFAEWIDLKDRTLTINHPVKNHLPGKNELSYRLVAMINALPRKDKRIFAMNYRCAATLFRLLRKRAAKRLQNPQLLNISFKSYRHFGGSMMAFYTNGNVMKVKAALRHRRVENTMKYIHAVENIKEEDFEETMATTPEDVRKLGKAGWTKYDEMTVNGVQIHFYRKPKKFGV